MAQQKISDKFPYTSKFVEIEGAKMHYVEEGEGDAILLLHGVPTSNYLWRNVIPHLAPLGRCIAPDLIGFGQSAKPNISYTIHDHIRYITKFIEALKLKRITLVMHGWGSIIGFNYAMQHEENCKGLVFYEAFLRSLNADDMSLAFQEQLMALQSQENLFDISSNGVDFVDAVISQNVMRELSDVEMKHYREPFTEKGTWKPLFEYFKDLVTGNGATNKIIADYSEKLTESSLPKLMLYSIPGFITTMATVMWAKESLPNLEIAEIGEELHLAQESCPALMGELISAWLQSIEQMHG